MKSDFAGWLHFDYILYKSGLGEETGLLEKAAGTAFLWRESLGLSSLRAHNRQWINLIFQIIWFNTEKIEEWWRRGEGGWQHAQEQGWRGQVLGSSRSFCLCAPEHWTLFILGWEFRTGAQRGKAFLFCRHYCYRFNLILKTGEFIHVYWIEGENW